MRIEASVTSISWIPSEAITGMMRLPFEHGLAHYDPPPPDLIDDLEELRIADRFRFANVLKAWIEVDSVSSSSASHGLVKPPTSKILEFGTEGYGRIGSTTIRLGSKEMTFAAVEYPLLESVERGPTWVKFTQTAGGRTGLPAPRPVKRPPFFQYSAPSVWTTLSLTIHSDGRRDFEVSGASPFPRHWIYDNEGKLVAKSGLIDFKDWTAKAFGSKTPWGKENSPALISAVESALERELSSTIMRADSKPRVIKIRKGKTLVEQGQSGSDLFLLLDGVLSVEVDGTSLVELGPGAILGERALLEGGRRTSTLRAVTSCRVAAVDATEVDRAALERLAQGHRREDA